MTWFETFVYIVVVGNLALTIELWRRAARRPEKLKRRFRNRLWRSKPITPKHQPPPPLKRGYGVGDAELQFFSDFEDFANVVNSWLTDPDVRPHNSPWRLQELPQSELSKLGGSGPTYGRTYAVFHKSSPHRQNRSQTSLGIQHPKPSCDGTYRTRLGSPPGLRNDSTFPYRHC